MRKKKGRISLDKLKLTNPQKDAVAKLVSAQKNKYKKLLHQAHERIHIIGDHTRNFEFWFNVMGHYEYVSPVCERVTGYTREEFMNGDILLESIMHPDDVARFRIDKKGAFSGSSGKDVEYKIVMKNGDERSVVISWLPVTTRWGKLIGVRGSVADITELKLYKNLVEKLGAKSTNGFPGVGKPAEFTLSAEGVIVTWDASAETLLGYKDETIIGKDFRELLNDRGQIDSLKGMLDQARRSGNVQYQAWLRTATNSPILGLIQLIDGGKKDARTDQLTCKIVPLSGKM